MAGPRPATGTASQAAMAALRRPRRCTKAAGLAKLLPIDPKADRANPPHSEPKASRKSWGCDASGDHGRSRGIGRATALKLEADGRPRSLTLCDVAYLDELAALAANRDLGPKVKSSESTVGAANAPPADRLEARQWAHRCGLVWQRGIAADAKLVDLDVATWIASSISTAVQWLLRKAAHPQSAESKASSSWCPDVGSHARSSDRRLQPRPRRSDHADRDDGRGMGPDGIRRQFRLPRGSSN